MYYSKLVGEIAARGMKRTVIAKALGISTKTLYNKISGKAPFTWPEVLLTQKRFFPDIPLDVLFAEENAG